MKKALIVYGGWEGHEPQKVSLIFKNILQKEDFEVELSDTLDIFADAEKLKGFNLIVPVWTMGEINNEYVQNISAALENGTGMAGCHGGMCDSFRNNTLWQFITGSQWVDHPGGDGVKYLVNIKKSSDSEIIEGMDDFTVETEQYYIHVDPAVNVLATTRFPVIDGPHLANGAVDVPVVYTKRWGKGKIFYNSLGHVANVFDFPQVKELMRRGFIWAAK